MEAVLAAWLASMTMAAVGLPFTFGLFRRLPDGGAGLAFSLGSLAVSLLYFLLRVASVLPPGRGGYLLAGALAAAGAAAAARRLRWRRGDAKRVAGGAVIAGCVFTGAFLAYIAFRSYNAEISGTEQPMDLLFLNASMTSPEYPPRDPWLAGEPVSYYYFGYVQAALLSSLANVPAWSGYNLALSFTFAATASAVVSVSWAVARWALTGPSRCFAPLAPAAALILVLFVGSLSAVFEWSAAHERYSEPLYRAFGVDYLLPCSPGQTESCYAGPSPRTREWYPTEYWFWWRGSRVIPDTITEFPFFSFLLGDLHPHLMALPMSTLAVAAGAAVWRGRGVLSWRTAWRRPWVILAFAAIFGGLAFQNAWDVITFSALLAVAVFARNWRTLPAPAALAAGIGWLVPAGVAAAVLYAPWWLTFSSQASGLYAYTGEGTIPAHAFLQFGVPVAFAALGGVVFLPRVRLRGLAAASVTAGWAAVLPFVGWVVLAAVRGDLGAGASSRGAGGWVTLATYGFLVWTLWSAALALAARRNAGAPVAAIGAAGLLLLYGAELFLIRDVFFGSVPRLNTVFKLSYQAWLLLGIAGSVAAAGLAARTVGSGPSGAAGRFGWRAAATGAGLLLLAGLVYPLLAAFNRTEGFSRATAIDGLAWLAAADPDEYALTRWITDNVPRGSVVIEATGRRWTLDTSGNRVMVDASVDYTDAGRIASRTGRETPIGWYFHEIQWRGDTAANRDRFLARQGAVDDAYLTSSPERVISVMNEFGADYLVLGSVEYSRYPGPFPDYDAFLDRVFEAGRYRVYRLPRYEPVSSP